jgi:putative two-component system response regulator
MSISTSLTMVERFRSEQMRLHEAGVGRLCAALSAALGFERSRIHALGLAADLHDIGKLTIPDQILNKPGRLDADEWEVMRQHAVRGSDILAEAGTALAKLGAAVALTHHECWDGSGYPKGLKGEAIPIEGRIVSLCDVYDAMREPRPYKEPRGHDEVMHVIFGGEGGMKPGKFDPDLMAILSARPNLFRDVYER